MNIGFDIIAANVGMNLENIMLLLSVVGSLIFFPSDFKLGVVMLFFTTGILFMLLYIAELAWQHSMIVFLVSLVLLCLSLYGMAKTQSAGQVAP